MNFDYGLIERECIPSTDEIKTFCESYGNTEATLTEDLWDADNIIYEHLGLEIPSDLHATGVNIYGNIPVSGCLFASRVPEYQTKNYWSWRRWLTDNDYVGVPDEDGEYPDGYDRNFYLNPDNCHRFKLSKDVKILKINGNLAQYDYRDYIFARSVLSDDQLEKIICDKKVLLQSEDDPQFQLNWKYVLQTYDGIELINGPLYILFRYAGFYSWDCDTICIWNSDVINIL